MAVASPLTAQQDAALAAFVSALDSAQELVGGRYAQVLASSTASGCASIGVSAPDVGDAALSVDEYLMPDGRAGYVVRCEKGGKRVTINYGPEAWRDSDGWQSGAAI